MSSKLQLQRQGDTMLVRVSADSIPTGGETRIEAAVDGRIIIEYGEVTGHVHALEALEGQALPELKWVTTPEFGVQRFAIADVPFLYTHNTHAPQVFQPGVYEVVKQFEAHARIARQVLD